MTSENALNRLIRGNEHYATGNPERPNLSTERRQSLLTSASPIAGVLSCADSRVIPESIFDCGIGDLFVVRNAGQIVDDTAVGSLDIAVSYFQVELIVVMGHTHCLAVETAQSAAMFSDDRRIITETIRSNLGGAKFAPADALSALRLHIGQSVKTLRSRILSQQEHPLEIRGALYVMETGLVEWL